MKHVPKLFKRTFAATKNIWVEGVVAFAADHG